MSSILNKRLLYVTKLERKRWEMSHPQLSATLPPSARPHMGVGHPVRPRPFAWLVKIGCVWGLGGGEIDKTRRLRGPHGQLHNSSEALQARGSTHPHPPRLDCVPRTALGEPLSTPPCGAVATVFRCACPPWANLFNRASEKR